MSTSHHLPEHTDVIARRSWAVCTMKIAWYAMLRDPACMRSAANLRSKRSEACDRRPRSTLSRPQIPISKTPMAPALERAERDPGSINPDRQ